MPQTRKQKRQGDPHIEADGHMEGEIDALRKELEQLKASRTPVAENVPLPRQSPFEGTGSFEAFKHQFEGLSRCTRWGEEEKRLRLLSSLKGDAAEYIFQLPDFSELSFQQILDSLERRFGDRRKASFYLTRLEARRLGRTESIAEYVADIRTLANKGYPTADRTTIEAICVRHFTRGLGDQQLSITVGMREPTTLEEARDIVEMYQGLKEEEVSPAAGTRIRQVNVAESAVTEERLKEFGEQLSNTLSEKVVTQLGHAMHFGGSRGGYRGRGRGRGRGYGPRQATHIRCYNCGEMGHYARDCETNRWTYAQQQGTGPATAPQQHNTESTAAAPQQYNTESTAASHHSEN